VPAVLSDIEHSLRLTHAEKCRRELLRRDYSRYYRLCYPKYHFGWFHQVLCRKLQRFWEDVEQKKRPRLQLWVPPQHGKTDNASRASVSWALGRRPDLRVIISQHSAKQAYGNSRWIRNRLRDDEHLAIFPLGALSDDSKAVDKFSLQAGGQLRAAGADTGVAGTPADAVVLDDFISGREQADSQTIRDKRWQSWQDDYRPRLSEGGGALIINTRWHQDDLSGRQIEQMNDALARNDPNADLWEIVCFPAIAIEDEEFRKAGEALFPEHKSLSELLNIKQGMSPRSFRSVYQQQPIDDQGSYYKKQHMRTYEQVPQHCINYITTDLAFGEKQTNDWTVLLPGGVDPQDNLHLLPGMIRRRMDALETCCRLLMLADQIDAQIITLPKDHIGRTMHKFLMKLMDGCTPEEEELGGVLCGVDAQGKDQRFLIPRRYYHIEWLDVVEDKQARGRAAQALQERGKALWPSGDQWTDVIQPELLSFPTGKNDDIADAFADFGRLLDLLMAGRVPRKPEHKNPDEKRWKEVERRTKPRTQSAIPKLFGRRRRPA
jgi:hypothetical protein